VTRKITGIPSYKWTGAGTKVIRNKLKAFLRSDIAAIERPK